MAKSQMERMLEDPISELSRANGAGGILYRLWVKLLADKNMGVSISRWEQLMIDFVNDPRNGVPRTKKDQTSMRGNLTKEFSRPNMTLKVFAKALMFLKVVKVDFAIKLYYENGATQICQDTAHFRSSYKRQKTEGQIPTIQQQFDAVPTVTGNSVFDEAPVSHEASSTAKKSTKRLRFQPAPNQDEQINSSTTPK